MFRRILRLLILIALLLVGLRYLPAYFHDARATDLELPRPAPELTHQARNEWINSQPLQLADLRGKVVLLDFWTFDCWNCYRSFPWLKDLEQRLEDEPFLVIGVHSPEFEQEYVRNNLVKKVKEFGLHHPVVMDNDFSYWDAMGNKYWPSFYLIDRDGLIQAEFFGEVHVGDRKAAAIEAKILELLD